VRAEDEARWPARWRSATIELADAMHLSSRPPGAGIFSFKIVVQRACGRDIRIPACRQGLRAHAQTYK